jgi:hypothetical protein
VVVVVARRAKRATQEYPHCWTELWPAGTHW